MSNNLKNNYRLNITFYYFISFNQLLAKELDYTKLFIQAKPLTSAFHIRISVNHFLRFFERFCLYRILDVYNK